MALSEAVTILASRPTPQQRAAVGLDLDIGDRARIGARAYGMLAIVEHAQLDAEIALERVDEGVDRAVAMALDGALRAVVHDLGGELPALGGVGLGQGAVADEGERPGRRQILALERVPDRGAGDLLAGAVGHLLDDAAELDLQLARQVEAVVGLQHIGDAALARLAVDADHRLVAAAQVLRIDRQIGHLPDAAVAAAHRRHALLDRVLVRAREGGEHQLAAIGMARMHRQLVAVFGRAHRPRRCRRNRGRDRRPG